MNYKKKVEIPDYLRFTCFAAARQKTVRFKGSVSGKEESRLPHLVLDMEDADVSTWRYISKTLSKGPIKRFLFI